MIQVPVPLVLPPLQQRYVTITSQRHDSHNSRQRPVGRLSPVSHMEPIAVSAVRYSGCLATATVSGGCECEAMSTRDPPLLGL